MQAKAKARNAHCTVCGTHEISCCGSRVRLSEKGAQVLTEPLITHCPLHEVFYGAGKINVKTVQDTVEKKMATFGFCCRNRRFDSDSIVTYGASEMMSVWLEKGLIDCAVVVCEGAGTVLTNNGKLVQGIGARLTGIIKTSPIQEIIQYIKRRGGHVLDETSARIDQVEGVRQAFAQGFEHVAVSVAGFQAKCISEIRRFSENQQKDTFIFSVCNTCIAQHDVRHVAKADAVCASASKILRKEIGPKGLLQVGVTIPVYALTPKGKGHVLAYLTALEDRLVIFRTSRLPYDIPDKGPKLKNSTAPC